MRNNLDTFKVLYIIRGCLLAVSSVFIFGYIFFISFLLKNTDNFEYEMHSQGTEMPFDPMSIIPFIISFGIVIGLFFIAFIVCNFLTARYLYKTKNYYFIFVTAILSCFTGILGLLLGVFTLIEISKPSIKSLFTSNKAEVTPNS